MQYVWKQPAVSGQTTLHRTRLKIQFHTGVKERGTEVKTVCVREREREGEGERLSSRVRE